MDSLSGKRQVRSRVLLMGPLVLAFVAMLAVAAIPAHAARVHQLEVSETLPHQESLRAVAVNQTTHHIYVVAQNFPTRVYNFDANGEIDPEHPELIGTSAEPEPDHVAVDNSGGAHANYIYVVNGRFFYMSGTVQQFDPEGKATGVTITKASIPPDGTPQAGGLPPVVNPTVNSDGEPSLFEPRQIAVDGSGYVFVTESVANAIDVFKPTGEFVRQMPIPAGPSLSLPAGLAIEGGDVYLASDAAASTSHSSGLFKLSAATGECVPAGCTAIDPAPAKGVALDSARGLIYTIGSNANSGEKEGKFTEYEASSGDLLGVTRPAALAKAEAIAVDEASGRVIVAATNDEREGRLDIFGPLKIVPDVETLEPEDVTDHSVTLKGEIGAAEVDGATCVFQYVDDAAYKADGWKGAAEAPCEEEGHPAGPYSGSAMHEVEAKLTSLVGGTTYHERLLGENENGTNAGEDIPFTTNGPSVGGTEAVEVTTVGATLKARVNPKGLDTTYRFQYLTQAQFESSGWAGASEIPEGGGSLGSGEVAIALSARLEGLIPRTAYRFRVLAVGSGGGSAGETHGEEVTFSTFAPPTVGLPDGRAYEQASPTQKDGTNIQGALNAVQASLDGERITFFANAGIPGGEGAQDFPTFMASRSSGGWSSQGLLPPASYGPRAAVLGWTEDLGDTYDFARRAFGEGELLLRTGPGSLAPAGTISSKETAPFAYAGSSQGGAVALLESPVGGLKDAGVPVGDLEGKQNVYAYGRESGRLVVAGVMNDGTVPPGGAIAGPYNWYSNGGSTTGLGGTLRNFYDQPTHAISADGSEIFFTAGGTGQLYVRLNPLAPQSSTSGEACTEAAKACTVRVSAAVGVTDPETPAAFLGASADGRFVYFLDHGKLTTTATGGSGDDLYRYEVDTGQLLDLTPDATDKAGARVEGMLGIGGPAGEDAYFVATGALAEGATQAPLGETNLYALDGTAIEFIVRLGTSEGGKEYLNWTPTSEEVSGTGVAHAARVSADGQTLLFQSKRKVTTYDSHGISELYLYRMGQGIRCISCNPTGEAPAGGAGVQEIPVVGGVTARTYPIMTRNLSADGRRVFFDSADRLVAADRNGVNDVYEWEAKGKGSCGEEAVAGGCIYLISGGAEGAGPSWFGDSDEEGGNVFFFTSQSLVAQDKDELVDVYDARVGGGIAAQEATPSVPCQGEAGCRGTAAPVPAQTPSPGSSSFNGPGDQKQPPACGKGKVRKHGKCMKKHKKGGKKHKGKKHKGKKHKKHKAKNKSSKKKSGKGKKGGKG